jgi:formylglycine-generating enzyme required for sulfatase activity
LKNITEVHSVRILTPIGVTGYAQGLGKSDYDVSGLSGGVKSILATIEDGKHPKTEPGPIPSVQWIVVELPTPKVLDGVQLTVKQTSGKNLAPVIYEMEVMGTVAEPVGPMNADLGGGVKLEMVWIQAGEFLMGSPTNEAERQASETQHKVRITKGFWIGKYEVTQAQWERVMDSNPSQFKQVGKDAPVEWVNWPMCQEFLKKLNAQIQNQKSRIGNGMFRLPTEAEWEHACRAETKTRYDNGDTVSDLDAVGWYNENSGGTTRLVGQKKPNAWGLYDMHGNVWEWCQDWYADYASGDVKDPEGPSSGETRILRGGSWYQTSNNNRSASRCPDGPGDRSGSIGFRVVYVSR